jgi:beta-glucosidase
VVGATIFPHNVGLGAMHDPALMRRIGAVTAAETAATGIDWAFGPTLATPQDTRWGRSYEGYSEDPALVRSYAGEMVLGLQGEPGRWPHAAERACRGFGQAFPWRWRHHGWCRSG